MTKYISFIFLLLCSLQLSAQRREELETRRKALNSQLKVTAKLLDNTRATKRAALDELQTLNAQIDKREQLLSVSQEELNLLSENIDRTDKVIKSMERDLAQLKKDYTLMLKQAFRYKSAQSEWLYVFSAEDLNTAYRRMQYVRRYADYRKNQVLLIQSTKTSLSNKVAQLALRKQEKEQIIAEQQGQQVLIAKEKKEQEGLVRKLKSQESQLQTEVKKMEESKQQLNSAIEDAIRLEMQRAKERARQAAASSSKTVAKTPVTSASSTELPLTPSEAAVAASFGQSKGKLPWPVDQGAIVGKFGLQSHPVLGRVTTNNNGVDIKTAGGANVRAVFAGKVLSVIYHPSFQYAVMVQHGNYFTVYTYLASTNVQNGDEIKALETIGSVYTNDEGGSVVHFEVWKDKNKQNPESWLK